MYDFCARYTKPALMLHVSVIMAALAALGGPTVLAEDLDGDGLLDVRELPDFEDLKLLELVPLFSRGIQDLDGTSEFTNASDLAFGNNPITSMEPGDFAGLAQLHSLIMAQCQLTSLDVGDLDGLTGLIDIQIFDNPLADIEPGAFSTLTNVTSMSLNYNALSTLRCGTFFGMAQLYYLDLGYAIFGTIEDGAFDGLPSLQTLQIPWNEIDSLGSGTFRGAPNLDWIYAEEGQIGQIEADTFLALDNLQSLYLGGNGNVAIESGAFRGLPALETLSLWGNGLSELDFTCAGFTNLRTFYADEGLVTSLVLNSAQLSPLSLRTILEKTNQISSVSMIGLRFVAPIDMAMLTSIETLETITIDARLFVDYQGTFITWSELSGHTLIIAGDLDGDMDIDIDDLGLLLASYHIDDGGDADFDGDTDFDDLNILLAGYGVIP